MNTLQLNNVSKTFGHGSNRVDALKNVNFKANAGEMTLILGPSGSGKSTLLTILGGLQKPTSGDVLINNHVTQNESNKESEKIRLNEIGFVLQSYNLVPYLTGKEQFELVDKVKHTNNVPTQEFDHILNLLGIKKLLNKYPNELSGGQAQRVAIARAIYANPAIILADEPTAALDSDRVIEVGKLLNNIAHQQNKAVVVVTHDLRLQDFADHIYDLIDGELHPTTKKDVTY